MSKFATQKFDLIKGKRITFHKLLIDGKCQFDEFAVEIESTNKNILYELYSLMECFANGLLLPKEKFRQIKGKKIHNLFEFKKKNIRIYVIVIDQDTFIINGGYKKNQENDIVRMQKVVKEFLDK